MTTMIKPPPASQLKSDLCSRLAVGEVTTETGAHAEVSWQLPEEVPVAIQINSEPFTVMMATPADLSDFAVGFTLAEGLIADPGAIKGVLQMPVEGGITIDIAVPEDAVDTSRLARRTIEGRSGCGLCGVEDIASAVRPLAPLTRNWAPDASAILKAAKDLAHHQPMNRVNRTVHGAAWVQRDGQIVLAREDVGRHNALDKLIGALARDSADRSNGFVVMTSRCSYELVQKCVTAGIGALITVSAPTALAFDLAKKSNLYLASLHSGGGAGGVVVFNT